MKNNFEDKIMDYDDDICFKENLSKYFDSQEYNEDSKERILEQVKQKQTTRAKHLRTLTIQYLVSLACCLFIAVISSLMYKNLATGEQTNPFVASVFGDGSIYLICGMLFLILISIFTILYYVKRKKKAKRS